MARPTTLPGIWAPLAGTLGVSGLAEALDTNTRTLNNWANNASAMPAVASGLLADLCAAHGVTPIVYQHPNLANGYVASTHEGWVMWACGLGQYGYPRRRRYMGHMEGLVGPSPEILCLARTHGWPW